MDWTTQPLKARVDALAALTEVEREIRVIIGPLAGSEGEGQGAEGERDGRRDKERLAALLKLADLTKEIAVLRASVDAGDGGLGAEVTRLSVELAAQRRRNIMLEECLERAGVHLEDEGAEAWADVLPAPAA